MICMKPLPNAPPAEGRRDLGAAWTWVAMALAGLGAVLAMVWGHGAGTWWLLGACAAAAICMGLAFHAGRLSQSANNQAQLHEWMGQHQAWQVLLGDWQWRTDAEHRLVQWQAPCAAGLQPALDASTALPALGGPAWDAMRTAALRTPLEARMPVAATEVWLASDMGASPSPWLISAVPKWDVQGRFEGHQGLARPLQPSSAASPMVSPSTTEAEPSAIEVQAAQTAEEQAAFNYTVSHDLRAPIRVVEGFTRILKEDYGQALDRVGNDHLDRVLAAAARMNGMIDALLALARLSTQPIARQQVNLSQLASFVAEDLRRHSPQRQVQVDIEPGLQALGDPTLLRMVLDNLLGNAWKYSAKREQAHIVFRSEVQNGQRVFQVQDNGAGFDMRSADRLFGVFQRLHGANEFPGTGVGLASVRRIVRRHGGQVWAKAEPGTGACFEFTLGD